MAYSVATVTSDIESVEIDRVIHHFNKLGVSREDLAQPHGSVDVLVGIQYAALHSRSHPDSSSVVGDLQLLTSQFGSGYLLDGFHQQISHPSIHVSSLAHKFGHSTEVMSLNSSVNLVRGAKVTSKCIPMFIGEEDDNLDPVKTGNKSLDFMEAEQLGTYIPKICTPCQGCSKCLIRGSTKGY